MTKPGQKYSACEREAVEVISAPKTYLMYLLCSNSFIDFSDQEVFRVALICNEIHARLARWLDVLADYEDKVHYRKELLNWSENFLFMATHCKQRSGGCDEEDLVSSVIGNITFRNEITDFESQL